MNHVNSDNLSRAYKGFVIGLCLLFSFTLGVAQSNAQAASSAVQPSQAEITRSGEIYLMRGLANVFSLGMDEMGVKFRELGFKTEVRNHLEWQAIVEDILQRQEAGQVSLPIAIIGHSLGAGIAPVMATELGRRGVIVSYVAMMDPVEPTLVGANVIEVENFYLPKNNNTNIVTADKDFAGQLTNIDLSKDKPKAENPDEEVNHLNIDFNDELQQKIISKIIALSDEQKSIEGQNQEGAEKAQ